MSQSLATELLELIVDCVAYDHTSTRTGDLLSLCLSCKALVPSSQKHLFRDVTLYPPATGDTQRHWLPTVGDAKGYRRTKSFLLTAIRQPHLAEYVRSLTCIFTAQHLDEETTLSSTILQAFERVTRIQKFKVTVGGRRRRLDFSRWSGSSSAWARVIAKILRNSRLLELEIHGLGGFPGGDILHASRLLDLKLFNTQVQPANQSDGPSLLSIPRLQRFTCDLKSYLDGVAWMGLQPPSHVTQTSSLVSQIEFLSLETSTETEADSMLLLGQVERLQTLQLTAERPLGMGYAVICPLSFLNPATFGTIVYLTLHIVLPVTTEIDLPYGWAWEGILTKLEALSYLRLHLEFQCHFELRMSSFGPQWGEIPELLANPSQLQQFKEIHILIEYVDRRRDRTHPEAVSFLDNLGALVYPRWFLPLQRRQEAGELLVFSYKAQASTGSETFNPYRSF